MLRASLERPPDDHALSLGDVLNAPFEVATFPVKLVLDGGVWLGGRILDAPAPPFMSALIRAGVRPGVTFDLGPRSGFGVALDYDGPGPVVARTAASWRGSQEHRLGLVAGPRELRLSASGAFQRFAEPHVWGIGMDTDEGDVADYRRDRWSAEALLEHRRAGRAIRGVALRVGVEENEVGGGGDAGVPDIGEAFPAGALPGEGETRFVWVETTVSLDFLRRDTLRIAGVHGDLGASGWEGISGTPTRFVQLRADVEGLLPVTSRHLVALRARAALTREDGGAVPFTHLPFLGDDPGLRAYEWGRFRDRDLLMVAAEWRWEVWRELRERGRVEGFVFWEEGAVARDLFDLPSTRSSYGFGLRMMWLGEYLGEAYAGFGAEGGRVGVAMELEVGG